MSAYPLALDNFATNKQDDIDAKSGADLGQTTTTGDHADHHNKLADAVNKMEAEFGIAPSAAWPTVKARLDGLIINVRDQGALGDGKTITDGAMSSSAVLNSTAQAQFTVNDVGKTVQVARALAASPADLYTTIAQYNSATSVNVKVPPGFTGTGRTMTVDGTRVVTDAATTADSVTVTSATIAFTLADVGKQVVIAAVLPRALNTTIASYTSPTQVTLSAAATRTFTGAQVIYGTNDTAALQASLVLARDSAPATVYIPKGLYLSAASISGTGAMLAYANTKIIGDGWASVIRTIGGNDNSGELLGINIWAAGSADPETNVKNVTISDIHLQGTTAEDGFYQYQHLLSMSAVSDVTMERVKFSNWRGDGAYLASATSAEGIERHNQHIKFTNCQFDGIARDNRNAISIIDGDDVIIKECVFRNSSRYDMPGPICLESNPGYYFGILRSIKVLNCHFWFCSGSAGSINGYFWESQTELTNPFESIEVAGCTFRQAVGSNNHITFTALQYPTDSTARYGLDVHNNYFFDGRCAMELEGIRGIKFERNWLIRAGTISGLLIGWSAKTLDFEIRNNIFYQCGADNSAGGYAVKIHNADRTDIDGNVFDNIGYADGTKGIPIELEGSGSISQPTGISAVGSITGGTLAAGTKSYRLTSFNDSGQTAATTAVTGSVASGSTGSVLVQWTAEPKAAGTKVYGRTGGTELLMATLGPNVGTWTDTGAITPAGALPAGNTSNNGASSDLRVVSNTFRQNSATPRMTQIARLAGTHIAALDRMFWSNNTVPPSTASVPYSIGPFNDLISGFKRTARAVSVTNLSLTPGGTTLTVDTVAMANGDRLLLVGQTNNTQNGPYNVLGIGTSVFLTRTGDFNSQSQIGDGLIIGAEDGAVYANSQWQLLTTNPPVIGTTPLRFTRTYPNIAPLPRSHYWGVSGDTLVLGGETINRHTATAALTLPAAATHTLFGGVVLTAGRTITNVNFHYTTAAATITIFYVSIIRASDRQVLATSTHTTAVWAAAPANKVVPLTTPYTPDVDTPVYLGIALASTTQAIISASVAFPATTAIQARPPILVGTTTTPTTTPITGTAAALTVTVGGVAYCWLT